MVVVVVAMVVVVVTVHCILRQVKVTVVRSSNWILPSCQPHRVDHLRPKQESVNNNNNNRNKNKQTTTKTTTTNINKQQPETKTKQQNPHQNNNNNNIFKKATTIAQCRLHLLKFYKWISWHFLFVQVSTCMWCARVRACMHARLYVFLTRQFFWATCGPPLWEACAPVRELVKTINWEAVCKLG